MFWNIYFVLGKVKKYSKRCSLIYDLYTVYSQRYHFEEEPHKSIYGNIPEKKEHGYANIKAVDRTQEHRIEILAFTVLGAILGLIAANYSMLYSVNRGQL